MKNRTQLSAASLAILLWSLCVGCSATHLLTGDPLQHLDYIVGRDTIALSGVRSFIVLRSGAIAALDDERIRVVHDRKLLYAAGLPKASSICEIRDVVYIGTDSGLFELHLGGSRLVARPLPARNSMPKITEVVEGIGGELWIGTSEFAAFRLRGTAIAPIASAPQVSCIAITPDSSAWIGSNIGIVRIFPNGEMKRYYEEIPANGIAIPDNIVEHMQLDGSNNLWIFMSQAVSVLKPEDYQLHHTLSDDADVDPHTYGFLGSPGSNIERFIQPPKQRNEWWAITSEGLAVLSNVSLTDHEGNHGMQDRLEVPSGTIRVINDVPDPSTGKSVALSHPTDIAFDEQGSLLIATREGMFRIAPSSLVQPHRATAKN